MTPPDLRGLLVIEDDVDAAEMLRDALRARGYQVQLAHDGEDALRLLREQHQEVVLCDLHLAGLDGFEIAAAIKGDPALAPTVLIAMSGLTNADARARATACGFDLFLPKPSGLAAIEATVASAFARVSPSATAAPSAR